MNYVCVNYDKNVPSAFYCTKYLNTILFCIMYSLKALLKNCNDNLVKNISSKLCIKEKKCQFLEKHGPILKIFFSMYCSGIFSVRHI